MAGIVDAADLLGEESGSFKIRILAFREIAMLDDRERYWGVLPAGGTGTRVGASVPKQYLPLGALSILERAAAALLAVPWVARAVVVVAPDDARAHELFLGNARVEVIRQGGATRRDSVLAGLRHLRDRLGASPDDWALVHDAARPGLSSTALERLRISLAGSDSGGLLALPVADTVKRARPGSICEVSETLDRAGLWLAQTPQMFRLALLIDALERHADVTDEASAVEAGGWPVTLVEGDRSNFKVTTPEDLELMRKVMGES